MADAILVLSWDDVLKAWALPASPGQVSSATSEKPQCSQSSRRPFRYCEAWDFILHYNGGADGGEVSPSAPSGGSSGNLPMPRYRAAVMRDGKKVWLNWCEGLYCTDGCGDTYAGIEGAGIVDFEIEPGSLGPNGWYEKNMRNGALIGLTVYYDTPDPGATGYYAAYYRVHWMGPNPAWGKWEYDDDDDGAGNDCDQVDMVELTIVEI